MSDSTPSISPTPFFGLDAAEFDALVLSWGWPRFRGRQVREWVYGKRVTDPARMTNLAKREQDLLRERIVFVASTVAADQHSEDGTRKLLIEWAPNSAVAECVMIPDSDRRTACLSSQVGCPVGCKFCASGINGVKGNLSAAQIVEQVYRLNMAMAAVGHEGTSRNVHEGTKARRHEGEDQSSSLDDPSCLRAFVPSCLHASHLPSSITNIVFMGMGEPLSNYANVLKAIEVLHDPGCFNIGARRITVSTVGVPAKMRQLAGAGLPINLAISLHAPNESLRKQLIPWAEHFSLPEILAAARFYFEQTGREVTLEYILLSGVNDRPQHARELARVCKTLRSNVNLIRYNEVAGLPFTRPTGDDVVRFQEILRSAGVNAHVRKSRGRDIDAACGQLRRERERPPAAGQSLVRLGRAGSTPQAAS